jgi:hypothetical protein
MGKRKKSHPLLNQLIVLHFFKGTVCPLDYICRQSLLFCYKYYGTRKSRQDSESSCAGEGAKLAIIDNADKDNEILSYISTWSYKLDTK